MSSTPSGSSRNSSDSRQHVIIEIISTLLPLVTVVVALRIWTRAAVVRSIGLDDWVIGIALIFTICTGVEMGVMARHGLGRHIDTLSAVQLELYLYHFYFSILFYYVSLGFIKLAILLQYFPLVAVKSKTLMIIITVGTCCWSIALVFTSIFSCVPIEGFWKPSVPAKCIPNLPLWYINAGGNILTDIIIFALPIPIVWKLKMPCPQRASLVIVFGLGFFTCTISIVRIEFLNLGSDFTYSNVGPAGWSLGEICAGIVCACLPTLRPLLFRVVPATGSLPRIKFSRYIMHSEGKQKISSRSSTEPRQPEESADHGYAMESVVEPLPLPLPLPTTTTTTTTVTAMTIGDVEAASESTESLTRSQIFRNVM